MGSEMCIRDSDEADEQGEQHQPAELAVLHRLVLVQWPPPGDAEVHQRCLLYTSDAADERSSVDLGGRRIIKKKKRKDGSKKERACKN